MQVGWLCVDQGQHVYALGSGLQLDLCDMHVLTACCSRQSEVLHYSP